MLGAVDFWCSSEAFETKKNELFVFLNWLGEVEKQMISNNGKAINE